MIALKFRIVLWVCRRFNLAKSTIPRVRRYAQWVEVYVAMDRVVEAANAWVASVEKNNAR